MLFPLLSLFPLPSWTILLSFCFICSIPPVNSHLSIFLCLFFPTVLLLSFLTFLHAKFFFPICCSCPIFSSFFFHFSLLSAHLSLFYPAALPIFIVNPCFSFPLSMEREDYHDDSVALHNHLKPCWKPGFMSQPCKHNGPQFLPRAFAFLFPREGFQRLEGNLPHTKCSLESKHTKGWMGDLTCSEIGTEVVEQGMGITCSSAHLVH